MPTGSTRMQLRTTHRWLKLSAVLGGIAWGVVLFRVDPARSDWWVDPAFYGTLWFLTGSIVALFLSRLRGAVLGEGPAGREAGKSVREGFLLALYGGILLFLQENRFFAWWIAALISVPFLLVELWFLRRERPSPDEH